ncbi:unnamed protein product [Prorocentrum cordatum]|uniref:ABM domain-containing protein n=1 Tax=Prorocentrum cordatum TaxID=2364126 RepID=A0ABN9RTQ6_9DINO|nr:unnamed protein product [Polarella glacialis]
MPRRRPRRSGCRGRSSAASAALAGRSFGVLLLARECAAGDSTCWSGDVTQELCCSGPQGNPDCWDAEYTFERCCGSLAGGPGEPSSEVASLRVESSSVPALPLLGGGAMPMSGVGLCCRPSAMGDAVRQAVVDYLLMGGRHLDDAKLYRNHEEVGEGLRQVCAYLTFHVRNEALADFCDAAAELLAESRATDDGCLRIEMHRELDWARRISNDEFSLLLMCQEWASAACLEAHVGSAHSCRFNDAVVSGNMLVTEPSASIFGTPIGPAEAAKLAQQAAEAQLRAGSEPPPAGQEAAAFEPGGRVAGPSAAGAAGRAAQAARLNAQGSPTRRSPVLQQSAARLLQQ